MTRSWFAVVIGALLGALGVWGVTLSGFSLSGWLAALIVTAFAVVGGVIGTGLAAGNDHAKAGPV